jgi:hypothetical protein
MERLMAFVCCLALLLTGCQVVVTPTPSVVRAAMDEPFTLHWGETARLPDARLDITFVSVPNDGRCPTNMACAESSPVDVVIQAQYTGFSVSSQLRLSAHTDSQGNVLPAATGALPADRYGSVLITLQTVTPYPESRQPIAPEDYAVTLLVRPIAEPTPALTPTAGPSPALGEEFSLEFGEMAVIEEVGLQLTFEEVVEDSRCPTDVQCVWSGIVDVRLTAHLPPQPAQSFVVGGTTDAQGNVLGPVVEASGPTVWWYAGYTITLKQVTPYPQHANEPIPFEDYAVTLVVQQATPNDPTPVPATPTATPFASDPTGLPVLCLSERVLTERIAGVTEESPARLTPPVAEAALADWTTATATCSGLFGDDFHIASTTDLGTFWTEYLPAGTTYWVWDAGNGQVIATP